MPPGLTARGRTPGISWRLPHLTFPERCELEFGQVPSEFGVARCLLELPVRLGGVKLGWEGLRRKNRSCSSSFGGKDPLDHGISQGSWWKEGLSLF